MLKKLLIIICFASYINCQHKIYEIEKCISNNAIQELVKILDADKKLINAQNETGQTPLILAVNYSKLDIVNLLLLKYKANKDIQDEDDYNAYDYSLKRALIKLILEYKKNPNLSIENICSIDEIKIAALLKYHKVILQYKINQERELKTALPHQISDISSIVEDYILDIPVQCCQSIYKHLFKKIQNLIHKRRKKSNVKN